MQIGENFSCMTFSAVDHFFRKPNVSFSCFFVTPAPRGEKVPNIFSRKRHGHTAVNTPGRLLAPAK